MQIEGERMNLQNLFKQFLNFSNLGNLNNFGGFGNQNFNQQNAMQQNQVYTSPNSTPRYPESFTTSDFENFHPQSCTNGSCNSNFNQNNSQSQNNNFNNPQFQGQPGGSQSFLNGLLGPNFNIASLAPLFSLFKKGKSSTLNTDSLPEGLKGLAPLINMFSATTTKEKENTIIIDNFEKIED